MNDEGGGFNLLSSLDWKPHSTVGYGRAACWYIRVRVPTPWKTENVQGPLRRVTEQEEDYVLLFSAVPGS